ncbi:hypothetical protein ACFL2E_06965 [Thermodesulfobacteriota bacterium]
MIYLNVGEQQVSANVVAAYLGSYKWLWEYQITQYERGTIDVKVVVDKQVSNDMTNQLEKKICATFKLDQVTITHVEQIGRTAAGKAKGFISMVDGVVYGNENNQYN